jgi:hypothetical protein
VKSSAGRASQSGDQKDGDPIALILRLIKESGAEFFHTPDHEAWATVTIDGRVQTLRIKDDAFKRLIGRLYYVYTGTSPSTENVNAALLALCGKAQFDGPAKQVYVRVAEHKSNIYIDLANEAGEVVKITPLGWKITTKPPVKFWRAENMTPLPTPVAGGDIGELRRFINLAEDTDFLLVMAWMVQSLRPVGPYPELCIEGEQGSAKTTASRVVTSFIDPNRARLRSLPKNERDLMISAKRNWCLAFENVSGIPLWLSDCFCRLSTGGGFATRRNYSDDEEVVFDAQRPVILNGISVGLERPDLIDRAIFITLGSIPDDQRQTEKEFWREFENARPRIFGALLDAISCALRRVQSIDLPLKSRMADFVEWVCAATPALGYSHDDFLRAYEANRDEANHNALEASPLVPAIEELADRGSSNGKSFEGTASKLLEELTQDRDRIPERWPKTAAKLSGEIRRLIPCLRRAGINVEMRKTPGSNSEKHIIIRTRS